MEPSAPLAEVAATAKTMTLTRLAWTGGLALIAAYCIMFVLLSPLPVQDLPGHLARAVAMDDLLFHGGARFRAMFHFQLEWIPYLLGDLILTVAVALLGVTGGAALWILLVFLSLPCAALFYLRARGIDPASRSLALLLSVYFATDWFFLMGFLSFRIAIAMLIATLALVEMLRRKWSYLLFALYCGSVVLDYLMHLAPIIFLFAALGVTGLVRMWLRTMKLRTEVALFLPVIILLAWHFTIGVHYREPTDPVASAFLWGTLYGKLARIGSEFFHFVPRADVVLVLLLGACLFAWTGVPRLRDLRQPLVLEFLALTVLFVAMYFVFPIGYAEAYYVDTRPLPLASFFFVAACLALQRPAPATHPRRELLAFGLAALLAVANLAYLARFLFPDRAWVAQYRSVIAAVPEYGRVLPMYMGGGEGAIVPLLHVSSYLVIDRTALEPYVFAADNGNPMKYFRYLQRPYDPWEFWYKGVPRFPVDWQAVARDYDFLVVTKPFDPAIVKLATRTVADNPIATVLAIEK